MLPDTMIIEAFLHIVSDLSVTHVRERDGHDLIIFIHTQNSKKTLWK